MVGKKDKSKSTGKPAFSLADSFPAASNDAWLALVKRILGDRPFEEALVSHTLDGIPVQPLYTASDWPAEDDPTGWPGMPPFTRGQAVTGQVLGGWDICQQHADPDRSACNVAIRTDLQRGVTSVLLRLDDAGRRAVDSDDTSVNAGHNGVMVACVDDLDALLNDIDLRDCPVFLNAGAGFISAASILAALWERRGIAPGEAHGGFNADPLGALAETGALPTSTEDALRQAGDLACFTAGGFPNVTSLCVDSTPYHNAGASEAQELAYAAATGVAYLRALTDGGLSVADAVAQIGFTYAIDADFLMSIAKLRAARRLWGRVAEASGAAFAVRGMCLHAITSERMMSRRDAWVNMLRATVSGFAAAVAGANRLTVLPFSASLGVPDDFAQRIARNTQLVLQEESSLSRVIDPAGGAWAVEKMTDTLANEAWSVFQGTEKDGGMAAVLKDGSVADRIEAVATTRRVNVATRVDALTGLSMFADVSERQVSVRDPDVAALRKAASRQLSAVRKKFDPVKSAVSAAVAQWPGNGKLTEALVVAAGAGMTLGMLSDSTKGAEPASISALPHVRLGEDFEALRDASDAYLARTGARPAVFLAVIGDFAAYTARATFASNLFAAGGIDIVTGSGGTDIEAIGAGFAASNSGAAVLCSDDATYGKIGPAVVTALEGAGAREIYVVGSQALRQTVFSGLRIDGMLYQGGDVLAVLTGHLERTGVLAR